MARRPRERKKADQRRSERAFKSAGLLNYNQKGVHLTQAKPSQHTLHSAISAVDIAVQVARGSLLANKEREPPMGQRKPSPKPERAAAAAVASSLI